MISLIELKKHKKINEYFYSKLSERAKIVPEKMNSLAQQAQFMTAVGVASEEDHKFFFYLTKYLKNIIANLIGEKASAETLAKVSSDLFNNRQQINIKNLMDFYKVAGQVLTKNKIPIKKIAYPQGDGVNFIETPRDLSKWMQAMRNIYALGQQPEYDLSAAFKLVTQNWDNMERKDFKYWMSFYEENAHQKYKTADKYYQAAPGVMIPIDHLKAKLPMGQSEPDMSGLNPSPNLEEEKRLKAQEVEKKIRALVSRLNAAERIASDPDVQKRLAPSLDIGLPAWFKILQDVKRSVQLAPMRNAASSILEDIVIKHANILQRQGFPKAARELRSFAQPAPEAMPAGDPVMGPSPEDGEEALDEFVEGMSLGGDSDDTNDIEDMVDDPLASITVIAQALPPAEQALPNQESEAAPAAVPAEPSPEVVGPSGDEVVEEEEFAKNEMHSKTDNLLEAALSNVTLNDVITRLETLANLFRTREIPRQLAIIDLMMDRLNISAFFPNLAEASSKSLESNQYALTRVEEILSKLRGAVKTPVEQELDLTGTEVPREALPEVHPEQVRQNLKNQEIANKARKERRQKEQEAAEDLSAQPITNVTEDLAQPVVPTPAVV